MTATRSPVRSSPIAMCAASATRYHRPHTVAGIKEQDYVKRLSEVDEVLIEAVVGDAKAVAAQIGYRTAGGSNLGVDAHQRHVASKDCLVLNEQRQ